MAASNKLQDSFVRKNMGSSKLCFIVFICEAAVSIGLNILSYHYCIYLLSVDDGQVYRFQVILLILVVAVYSKPTWSSKSFLYIRNAAPTSFADIAKRQLLKFWINKVLREGVSLGFGRMYTVWVLSQF